MKISENIELDRASLDSSMSVKLREEWASKRVNLPQMRSFSAEASSGGSGFNQPTQHPKLLTMLGWIKSKMAQPRSATRHFGE